VAEEKGLRYLSGGPNADRCYLSGGPNADRFNASRDKVGVVLVTVCTKYYNTGVRM